jgi:membrane protease YdiL (CAAX protease family)
MGRSNQHMNPVRRALDDPPRASKRKHRQRITETKTSSPTSIPSATETNSGETSIWPIKNLPLDLWPFLAICLTACLSLFLLEFVADEPVFLHFFPPRPGVVDTYWVLRFKTWWVAVALVGYVALPVIVLLFLPGKRLRDCNLGWRGFREHYWVYIGLYALVFPVIWLVSFSPDFYNYYPMYPQAGRSWFDLLVWESLYAGQFVALEFFFRGFLVGGLSRSIGIFSIPVAVIPYMMIHFTKPWPEALASIVAGLVLGTLAWRTKSIWGGVCIHCAVAVSMDLLALSHKGQLPWLHQ